MKVVILAGGLGTRLSELTGVVPKPMIKVGGKPIIWHIMQRYSDFNHKDFYLALGYKSEIAKEYFLNYQALSSDFTIELATGKISSYASESVDWKVTLVNTGEHTLTGGRVKRMKDFVGNETFFLTYGDGLSNINLDNLLKFHRAHGKMVTMTAVKPSARFGELQLDGDAVIKFEEKPQLNSGWVNGGFFVIEPKFLDLIEGDASMLEREPLEAVASLDELRAFRHDGFWQCMDTKRDHEVLESLWLKGAPWL